ncbi:MAG: glycosyltransferase family 2 protein [Dysgonamonadaceae bacterium]
MTKISVLIAVYNTEKYLPACLHSLLAQTEKEIQIICVDDASTDNSLNIIRQFAKIDQRIHVIELAENQGQAKARNEALKIAEGEFITMLDSDDWLSNDAFEKALDVFYQYPQTDTVLYDLIYFYENTRAEESFPLHISSSILSGQEAFELSLDWKIHGLYLIRASIHKQYPYDTSKKLFSDDNTTRFHYLHSREVRFCNGRYFYRQHDQSMTKSLNFRRFDMMEANISLLETLKSEGISESIILRFQGQRWLSLIDTYWFFFLHHNKFSRDEQKEVLQRMKYTLSTFKKEIIPATCRRKFGYCYVQSFLLFRLQVESYFRIRAIAKKFI